MLFLQKTRGKIKRSDDRGPFHNGGFDSEVFQSGENIKNVIPSYAGIKKKLKGEGNCRKGSEV